MSAPQASAQPALQKAKSAATEWIKATVPEGAQEVASYKGRRYRITTSNYHAFGPMPPGVTDSSIIATVYLIALDGGPPDPDLIPVRAWFIADGQRVWETAFTDETRPTHADRIEKVARGGPQKSVDSPRYVDVVVRVKAGAKELLLLARRQAIAG
jgi:hypothetical protein